MKIHYFLFVFVALVNFTLSGQKVPTSAVSTGTTSVVSPSDLTEELDFASANSRIYFHAKEFIVDQSLSAIAPLEDGYYYKISAPSLSIRLYLNIDAVPLNDTLFILNKADNRIEAIYADNFYDNSWSSFIYKDELTLYYKNSSGQKPQVTILSYSLELPKNQVRTDDFGDSDPCEVNVNCSEGDNFEPMKKAIARILVKNGSFYSWCTGAMVNNTAYDCRKLFMTAEHCGLQGSTFSNTSDVSKWEFYFNYEAPDCANISSEGQISNLKRITGAKVLARSDDGGGDDGSDFVLLELIGAEPPNFEPYYLGWNRANTGSTNGVVMHHPEGDVKKISTYTNQAVSGEYGATNTDTHWLVYWSKTANGHGVTEGGSSGSALLDPIGRMTGMLTGGAATCSSPTQDDYFGKLSYSWKSNGTASNRQLAPWLDPNNSGVQALSGSMCGDTIPAPKDSVITPSVYPTSFNFRNGNSTLNFLDFDDTIPIEVQIFDLQGKLKYRSDKFTPIKNTPTKIDISRLISGLYIVRVVGKLTVEEYKILVTNVQ